MNEKDAAVIKVLSELGLREDPPVRPEFEHLYPNDDPDEQFYDDVIRLFAEGDVTGGKQADGPKAPAKLKQG